MILLLLIRNGNMKIIDYLVGGKYSNVEAADKSGLTPLHYAVR